MIDAFRITKRHYGIILKQGLDNLPMEMGGFLGGEEGLIKAVHPLFNAHLYNKTDTFSFTREDVDRAHRFFKKHQLDYYGLYHSHPNGAAYPSDSDINTGHMYHFILSLKESDHPVFNAFYIKNRKPIQIPLSIINLSGMSPVDIRDVTTKSKTRAGNMKSPEEEAVDLAQTIANMKDEKQVVYPVLPPKDKFNSDFSTMA
jgi:proteasome lid subunit RPN8/RPN11